MVVKSAVHPLETHPDHIRIQKLLYFVYSKLWIADVNALDGLSIPRLLNLLMDEASSIKQLEQKLISNAERLNKPDTYLQLAHSIIETLRQGSEVETQASVIPFDQFKLRYAIMQVLNPWKAKAILVALYYAKPSSSSRTSISPKTLEKFSLDELLRKIMDLYPSLPELESGLQNLDHCSADIPVDERRQLAQTLKEALRPYLLTHGRPPSESHLEEDLDSESLCTIVMSPKKLKTSTSPQRNTLCLEDV